MLLLSFSTFLPSLLHLLGYGWRKESFGILHIISVETAFSTGWDVGLSAVSWEADRPGEGGLDALPPLSSATHMVSGNSGPQSPLL